MNMNILRMVQLSAKGWALKLPSQTDKVPEEFETEGWLKRETKRVISIRPDGLSANFGNRVPLDSDQKGQPQVRKMTGYFKLLSLGDDGVEQYAGL